MKGKKNLLAKSLYAFRLSNLINRLRGHRLITITYHRIGETSLTKTVFDDGVFGVSAAQFEDQMLWLKEHTEILSESEAIEVIYKRRKPEAPSVLITFDDAYIDNYTIAYPILKRLGIPAIFFVATKLINERKLGWWDIVAYIFKQTNKQFIKHGEDSIEIEGRCQKAIDQLLREIKLGKHTEVDSLLERLADLCEVNLPGLDAQSSELMTWDQIREVSQNGISIGSHTDSHRILSVLNLQEQENELYASKMILESELGHKIRTMSYPVGNSCCFTSETEKIARKCGYEVAFAYNTSKQDNINPFSVKRICAPPSDRAMLVATLAFPLIFNRRL